MKNITHQFLKTGFRFTNKIINKFGILLSNPELMGKTIAFTEFLKNLQKGTYEVNTTKIKEVNTLKIIELTYIKKYINI
jgi:hypothetical protein